MTKSIRIENADTSDHKVVVEVWDRGNVAEGRPDTLVKEVRIDHPTALVSEYIHSSRYIVVKEVSE